MGENSPQLNGLTARQNRFIQEYLIDEDHQAAALRAGYSAASARSTGFNLLQHPQIRQELEVLNKTRTARMGITKDRVLQELCLIAFVNPQDLMTEDEHGKLHVNLKYLPKEVAAAMSTEMSTVETDKGKTTVIKSGVKMSDKLAALEKLGKYLGMFKEQVEHTGTLTLEQLVEHSFKKNDNSVIDVEGEEVEDVPQLSATS